MSVLSREYHAALSLFFRIHWQAREVFPEPAGPAMRISRLFSVPESLSKRRVRSTILARSGGMWSFVVTSMASQPQEIIGAIRKECST